MKRSDVQNYRLGLETLTPSELREQSTVHTAERTRLLKVISKAQSALADENRMLKHIGRERIKRKKEFENHVDR